MINKKVIYTLSLFSVFFLLSCGSSDNDTFASSAGSTEEAAETTAINDSVDNSPAPTLTSSSNPPCDTLAFGDGRGGDLWLDDSASNGLPVYLLNNGWQEPATVDAQLVSGGTERANFTGFANPDAGVDRPHFRFTRNCSAYTGRLTVTDANQVCVVQLPGPSCSRID